MVSEKPWAPEGVLQLVIRLFASMFLGIVVISGVASLASLKSGQVETLSVVVSTLSFHGVAVLLTHFFLRREGLTWADAFGFTEPAFGRAMLLALVVAAAVLPIAWSLGAFSAKIMQLFHIKPAVQAPVQMLESAEALPTRILIGVIAVLVAPCAEETVFRGLIYPTLKQLGFPKLALWGTSILFALVHSNLMILLPLTVLAVILTLLYERTGNLLAPILAHSVFNFVNFLLVPLKAPH